MNWITKLFRPMRVIKELRRVNDELVEKHKQEIWNKDFYIGRLKDDVESMLDDLDSLRESINSDKEQLKEEIEELREYKDKYINLLAAYETLDLKKQTEQ